MWAFGCVLHEMLTGRAAFAGDTISDNGGGVDTLTQPVHARGELNYLWPEMLPGGRALLFTITATTGARG